MATSLLLPSEKLLAARLSISAASHKSENADSCNSLGEHVKRVPEGICEYKVFLSVLCFGYSTTFNSFLLISVALGMSKPMFYGHSKPCYRRGVRVPKPAVCSACYGLTSIKT